jgi:hypothetical protein
MKTYAFVFAKTQCANTLRWQTLKAKISTSPSPAELVHHSSYDSSALLEIFPSAPLKSFPGHSPLFFPFFLSFFFLPRLKYKKLQKKKRFN